MAKFIVIEGPDRVGKATQCKLLHDYFTKSGLKSKVIEVPVHDNFTYNVIYWMLGNGLAKKFPKIFQVTQHCNRHLFQWQSLKKLDHDYDYLIMDRWSLSTVIYGAASGVNTNFTENLYRMLREPDHTIVLLGKAHQHVAEDVYEKDTELQLKVKELYRQWAESRPGKTTIIDCNDSREKIFDNIIDCLLDVDVIEMRKI